MAELEPGHESGVAEALALPVVDADVVESVVPDEAVDSNVDEPVKRGVDDDPDETEFVAKLLLVVVAGDDKIELAVDAVTEDVAEVRSLAPKTPLVTRAPTDCFR